VNPTHQPAQKHKDS